MKIDEHVSNYLAKLDSHTLKPAVKAKHLPGSPAHPEDASADVDFSSVSLQLAEDEARRERLNAIRQQLAEGTYNISGKDVANKILTVLKG